MSMPPKSDKLRNEEAIESSVTPSAVLAPTDPIPDGPIEVREIACLNDFVAIMQFEVDQSIIARPDSSEKYKNEGLVIGVGPGVSDNAGGRLAPQVKIGDVVMFGKNIVTQIASDSPPYAGRNVVIVSERNLLCKLPKTVNWVEYNS
jgi:chaperonin GroES